MSGTPILESVSAASVTKLAERGTLRQYRRGTYLFHQGDPAPDVLFLWRGRVEITSPSITGHRPLHTTLDHPQFFRELWVLAQMRRAAKAMPLARTTVSVVH